MNRPIKFRAWDKKKKAWIEDFWVKDGIIMVSNYYAPDDWSEPEYFDAELMQFTGLLDKNGKEIYEGDIIHPATLKYAAYVVIEPHGTGLRDAKGTWQGQISHRTFELKVIGNVHEDSDLLV